MRERRVMQIAGLLLLLLIVAACGADDDSSGSPSSTVVSDQTQSVASGSIAGKNGVSREVLSNQAPVSERDASFDKDGDGFMNLTELEQAIDTSIDDYTWPPDATVLAETLVAPFYSSPSASMDKFEVPYHNTLLSRVNTCAWYSAWLTANANGDESSRNVAIGIMVDEIPYYPALEADQSLLQEYARSASLGDPSKVQSYYMLNCDGIESMWNP